jgi:hypothetical protein
MGRQLSTQTEGVTLPQTSLVYQRGQFFQQLAGPNRIDVADVASTRPYYGLDFNMTFLYGNLRAEDGSMHELVRNFPVRNAAAELDERGIEANSATAGLILQSVGPDGTEFEFDLEEIGKRARTDNLTPTLEDGKAVWQSPDTAEGAPVRIEYGESEFFWEEEGLLRLTGTVLHPGLQWYAPGREYGTYYASSFVQLEGEFRGLKVTGMLAFDQLWMGTGGELYTSKDLVMENKGHLIWYTWATRYTDGSWEGGHFMLGNGPLGFALVTDGENTIYTQDITGRVLAKDGEPFAERIELTVDGEQWEFLPDPRGTMPGMLRRHPPTPQQEGRWQRVGETRTPETYFAWAETEPEHGRTPSPELLEQPAEI